MIHYLVNHHITGHLVFVLVSTVRDMSCPAIDNPTSCEIRALIRSLHAKTLSAEEIHRELCAAVYGQNVMNEGTVRQGRAIAQAVSRRPLTAAARVQTRVWSCGIL
jgi:hypothetical protein